MTTYKFTSPENAVVAKIDDDGISRSSCSIKNPEYLAWLAKGNTPEPVDPPTAEQIREEAVRARTEAVAALKVTTQAGNTFDGDEVSQGRMARAIIALQATGTPTVTWVLADNSVIQATVAELTEALALAGAAQAAIWVIP